ncbi:MAG: hypothetical protein IPO52_05980 [Gemmatimonadetes bacterium]|nr:hypothetical protein [Gemmatimonadota bacterium]MBK9548647.1 hypothetical protein [Gemmatimonadota bacterium]
MSAVSSLRIGSRQISLYRFTGEVLDSQRSSHTTVTSHQNGQVSAQTEHYNQVFLRASDGEERSVEVASAGVAVRVGNIVTVGWGLVGSNATGSYATVWNHDTNQVGHIAKAINDTAGPPLYNMMIIVFVFIGVFNAMGVFAFNLRAIFWVGLTFFFFWWLTQRRRTLRAALEAVVRGG